MFIIIKMVGHSTGCFGSIIIKCEDIETKGVKQYRYKCVYNT